MVHVFYQVSYMEIVFIFLRDDERGGKTHPEAARFVWFSCCGGVFSARNTPTCF